MTEQIGNSLTTPTMQLAGGINASVTTMVVQSVPSSVPSSGTFRVVIDEEIIIVGTIAGTTLSSLTRGAEGTAAETHSAGAAVDLVLTAGGLAAYVAQGGGAQTVLSNTVNLTSADILALHTSSFEIVPAPAAGFVILPVMIASVYTGHGTFYTLAGVLGVSPGGDSTLPEMINVLIGDLGVDTIGLDCPIPMETVRSVANGGNLSLTASVGNPTLGNGTMKVTTYYTLLAVT